MALTCTRTSSVVHSAGTGIGISAGGARYDGKVGLVDGTSVGHLGSISSHHVGADFALALMAIEIVARCKGRATQTSMG